MLISRLSPMDYHRFHYPVSGEIAARRNVRGMLYSVSPIALAKKLSILWENRRVLNLIETDGMGLCAFAEIGATNVGTIVNFDGVSARVKRGAEAGLFHFGGSCVATIFERNARIDWNPRLVGVQRGKHRVLRESGGNCRLRENFRSLISHFQGFPDKMAEARRSSHCGRSRFASRGVPSLLSGFDLLRSAF